MTLRKDVAEHLDMSTKTLARLVDEGVVTARPRSGIDIDTARREYINHLRHQVRKSSGGSGDYSEEKTRLTRFQADKAEAEVDAIKGVTVEATSVIQHWGDLIANARARLLALPTSITPRLQAAEDEYEITDLLTEEIEYALDELSGSDGLRDNDRRRMQRGREALETPAAS